MKLKRKLFTFYFSIFFCIFSFQNSFAQNAQAAPVKIKLVENKNTEIRRLATGNIEVIQKSIVASQEPGLVIKADIQEGKKVTKGSVLVELDATRLKLELETAKQQTQKAITFLNQKEIELKDSTEELNRLLKAEKQTSGSISQLDTQKNLKYVEMAKLSKNAAEQERNIAQLKEAMIEVRLKDMVISAPFDGVITKKSVEVGEWLNPGTPIITLNSIGIYKATIEIPEIIPMSEMQNAKRLELFVGGASKALVSEQLQVIPEISTKSRVYLLTAILKNETDSLASGQSVQAYLPTSQKRDFLVIPTDSVTKDAGGNFVYKVFPGEKGALMAMPVNVKILFSENNNYFVESQGLNVGDQIVIEGNERLRPMMPVSIVSEEKK